MWSGVSIHAPARGRTHPFIRKYRNDLFQSTPPRGGEPHLAAHVTADFRVSIHAPARGRTESWCNSPPPSAFQSTPPRGGERGASRRVPGADSFNPRPRAGANQQIGRPSLSSLFQSTPPRGGEQARIIPSTGESVSIHAPARGRTSPVDHPSIGSVVSIHAPARGRTR